MNVLKAGLIVKPCDNRSKNDCIPIQLSQKAQYSTFSHSTHCSVTASMYSLWCWTHRWTHH